MASKVKMIKRGNPEHKFAKYEINWKCATCNTVFMFKSQAAKCVRGHEGSEFGLKAGAIHER